MMASQKPRDLDGAGLENRRGHANQPSISETSDHITETIGTMYGDDDDYQNESRPSSFIAPRSGEQFSEYRDFDLSPAEEHGLRLVLSTPSEINTSNHASPSNPQISPISIQSEYDLSVVTSKGSAPSPVSTPPMSPTLRDMRDDPDAYPLTSIDNPSDIAQELSNLQAIRRMSMDVSNNSDPDLLPFQGMSLMAMPSIAPKGDDDADPSRLLWVPAGVHPELAPSEFKNFVEKRVQSMRKRSSEISLSPDSLNRSNSAGLRRKKSMLSRQVENGVGSAANGPADGTETSGRKLSLALSESGSPELSLDELMKDPSKAVRKLAFESQGNSDNTAGTDDMPILPMAPGTGLRRSTRTTYRKGGSLKNRQASVTSIERPLFSQRIPPKKSEGDDGNSTNPEAPLDASIDTDLGRMQSETLPTQSFRSSKSVQDQDHAQPARSTATIRMLPPEEPRSSAPVSQNLETPVKETAGSGSQEATRPYPERTSSQRAVVRDFTQPPSGATSESSSRSKQQPTPNPPSTSSSKTQASNANAQQPKRSQPASGQNRADPAQVSSSSAKTDTSAFIPTFSSSEEKKAEKRSKKDNSEGGSSKGPSWKWFKSEEREKRKKEEEARKSKAKGSVEKAHDNVRLDVLQTSIDTAMHKGRESLLLERENMESKLEEERRKESNRKFGEHKKEKDSLFSTIFGGNKRKGEKDSSSKKSHAHQRPVSPEPAPYRPLRPDTDYPWTRFPILEERAIYRMAHIKLANPRRALHSQVLLSNFMYAYLAKVQALNPQIQVPQSPQQRRLQEEERKRKEQEQQYLEQQQAQESIDRYNFEYHRSASEQSDANMQHDPDGYSEGDDMFDYDHDKDNAGHDGGCGDTYVGAKDHYAYGSQNGQQHNKEEDMW